MEKDAVVQPQYIYIMFTHTGTWFSKVLRLITRNEFTHVSISLDKSLTQLYSFGRNTIKERPWEAGFVHEDPRGGVYKELSGTHCVVYQLEVSSEQYLRAKQIIEYFLRNQSEFKYNFPGLFFMAMGWPKRFRRRFVCSQFVAFVLENSGTLHFEKDFSLIRPQDLGRQSFGAVLYRGELANYDTVAG
ncbi:hypothetical protein H8K20_10905 [Neobittarella massiliensis]|uniref:Uncharacterized protein n=2 Tax=Oscillospiraceae TaxID=216572 RepID=A0A8J6IGX8_9FIRM|nr:hypothetical protein [Neobittarella massiliensis]MBC3516905.1 hypothetical protein [Neobittarella massiliensis]SCJ81759.1 Uncharacterised protein [uncultured Anaerotruncus sp.]